MNGKILTFPTERARAKFSCGDITMRDTPGPAFADAWCDQHLPLIDAAIDLLQADDAEFGRRLRAIADQEGKPVLATLATQIDRLAAHVIGIANALAMTAMRIRTTMATGGAGA